MRLPVQVARLNQEIFDFFLTYPETESEGEET